MLRFLLIAAIVFIAGCLPSAQAQTPAPCQTAEQITAEVLAAPNPVWAPTLYLDLTGEAAQLVLNLWNEVPPVSNTVADRALIYLALQRETGAEHGLMGVAFLKDGCRVDAGLLPTHRVREVLPES